MSDKHHGLFDSLKSLVVDETPETPPVHASIPTVSTPPPAATPFSFNIGAPAVSPAPVSASTPPSVSSFVNAAPAPGPEAEDFYQKLVARTDFEQTKIAATLHLYLDPLANLPLDATMKFKTAIAQAKAQAGVTEDAILSAFDDMKTSLSQAQSSFNTKAAAFETTEITARQARLTEIQTQITALQAEQTQVSTDLSEAQAKSARTQSGFNSAIQRRSVEIDQQKAQYAAMLK